MTAESNKSNGAAIKIPYVFFETFFPFFHKKSYVIAEKNQHRHMKNPADKLKIAHSDMPKTTLSFSGLEDSTWRRKLRRLRDKMCLKPDLNVSYRVTGLIQVKNFFHISPKFACAACFERKHQWFYQIPPVLCFFIGCHFSHVAF